VNPSSSVSCGDIKHNQFRRVKKPIDLMGRQSIVNLFLIFQKNPLNFIAHIGGK